MKTEDFFRQALIQLFGADSSAIDKHFKNFKSRNKKFPAIIKSLDKAVVDSDNIPLNADQIKIEIENLKTHFQSDSSSVADFFYKFIEN